MYSAGMVVVSIAITTSSAVRRRRKRATGMCGDRPSDSSSSGAAAPISRCSQREPAVKPRWRSSSEKLVRRDSGCSSLGVI